MSGNGQDISGLRTDITNLIKTNATLEERVSNLIDMIKGDDGLIYRLGKVEGRVSALENWKWYLVGAAAAVSVLIGLAFNFLPSFHK
jgi:hypothetical protein